MTPRDLHYPKELAKDLKQLPRTVTYAREIARQLNEPELTLVVGMFNDAAVRVSKGGPHG